MDSRRSFIKKVGKGAAFSTLALSSTSLLAAQLEKQNENNLKPIRVGIIGAENSHTIGFGKMFNVEKKFPGVEVKYVWGETEEFAKNAMEKGSIPNRVKDPNEMLGKIDALIVDHRHAKFHLEAATPFIKEKVPTFIDKPFCYRLNEGKEFLAIAREYGTPVTSYSSIAQSEGTFDIKKQVEQLGEFNNVVRYGPVELDSKYGGVFFYGVHILQPLMFMFGEDIEKVRIARNGSRGSANLLFKSGLYATLVFTNLSYGWSTFVETKNGVVQLKSQVEEPDPGKAYVDMVNMFRTGKEPRSHQSILNGVAVLEALEKSAVSEKWVNVEY
uniref:Gfo/Idh/MocA family protein n=1 Tax=uncultured Draconibacterium sp. TaxID=1573823 RepID=UPI0032171707